LCFSFSSPFKKRWSPAVLLKGLNMKILLWLILFVICWPLAILALVLYPLIWLLLLPFKLVGIAVEGVFELLRAILLLPSRLLKGVR
jgi:hypothetical protein